MGERVKQRFFGSDASHQLLITSLISILILLLSSLTCVVTAVCARQAKRPFTVTDEISLALYGYGEQQQPVRFSPDGNYFAVSTERGRLNLNRVEDSLRFYRSQDIENFLGRSNAPQPPPAEWVVSRSDKEGPVIHDWRWLADSSGVAFLERAANGNQRIVLASLQNKKIEPLTSEKETVKTYDIRDRQHYIYTAVAPGERWKGHMERQAAEVVGTDRSLYELLLPDDPVTIHISPHNSYLWAVTGGKPFEVKHNGAPIVPGVLALSPDGGSVATTLPIHDIPPSWETLYPPPYPSDPYRFHTGGSTDQYVRIDLQKGLIQALTDAPTSRASGLWAPVLSSPKWSSDGQEILLPGTFLSSEDHGPSRPCIAVVDLSSGTRTCVEILKGRTETGFEEGYHSVKDARFVGGDRQRVAVSFYHREDLSVETTEYKHATDGDPWRVVVHNKGQREAGPNDLQVTMKQGLNDPPVLIATNNKNVSRAIWDPNPQLKNVELMHASIYAWKDKEGREWKGALFKPNDYQLGRRYPLVIQTHGFPELEFRPSGVFPTAFAARALAAAGIVVLQISESVCPVITPEEGNCVVLGYEAAANQLIFDGLVDPERIGIIGFSRTCFYVMEALTKGSLRFRAASITDGVMETYLQYMTALKPGDGGGTAKEANSIIGAKPFGEGLQQWLKRSPGFNLDKVTAPLLVVGEGPVSLLFMWEPYAGLRYLNKPVDLIMLNTDEHVLTNPSVRLASQGGSVDWFRFWLQGYEDASPAKAGQYVRWRELRRLQQENEHKPTRPQAVSN